MDDEQDEPSDRRRAARIPINAEFATIPSATYISDLSEYGVFLHTPKPSPRGTKLKLRFSVLLDDPVIVEAEGRVVRQQFRPTPGMGIEFTELGPDMILRINDVLSRQRPRDSGPPLAREELKEGLREVRELDDDESDAIAAERTLTRGKVRAEPPPPPPSAAPPPAPAAAKGQSRRKSGPSPASSGSFRPPPVPKPAADEHAKTGLYQPVEKYVGDEDVDDWESE